MSHDDELFSILERAIGPNLDDAPSDAEREQLRTKVDDWRRQRPVPITTRSKRWIRRSVATGIGGIVVVSGATAVAAAANDGVLPGPARTVARSVGLPVESSDLARARAALGRLRGADDSDRDELESELADALTRLSPGELAKISAGTTIALAEAEAHHDDRSGSSGSDSPSSGSNSGPGSSGSGSDSGGSGSSGSGSDGSGADSGSSGSGSSGSGSGSGSSGSGSSGSGSDGSGSGSSVSGSSATDSGSSGSGSNVSGGESTTSVVTTQSPGGEPATTSTTSSTVDGHRGSGGGADDGGGGKGKG